MNKFDFDSLELAEVPVKYRGTEYTLQEASGRAAKEYRNARIRGARLGPDGSVVSMGDVGTVEPLLVSLCLFNNKNNKNVPQPIVESWPEKIVKPLFDWVMENSDLTEEPKEREQLQKALDSPDSPISLGQLRDFVGGLSEEDFADIQKWLKPSRVELAKNEPEATTDGSE